jgi:NAD(P)-dependent dehydrogenase (short-subunit alcohol dehydrogenase family)
VVHISSDAAVEAYPRWGAYGVAKAAQDHLARTFAAELGEHGIHFLSIDPGEMNTQMHAAAIPEADPATLADPAQVAARIVRLLTQLPIVPTPGSKVRYAASELPQEERS